MSTYVTRFEISPLDYSTGKCYGTVPKPSPPPSGVRLVETLVCTSVPRMVGTSVVYDSGAQWKTTIAAYVPGSEVVSVNGIAQFGRWERTDPASGIITLHVTVYGTDTVTMSYIGNGAIT